MKRAVIYGDIWLTSHPKECLDHAWTLWGICERSHVIFKTKWEITVGKTPKDHQQCAAWLRDVISSDYTKGKDACAVPGCDDGRMQPHHFLHIQTHRSAAVISLASYVITVKHQRRQTCKAMNWAMRKPSSCCSHNVPDSLWVALHVLATAASLLSVAGEGT